MDSEQFWKLARIKYIRANIHSVTNPENKSPEQLELELAEMKAQKEKLERELIAREELMQSMFSLLAEKKKQFFRFNFLLHLPKTNSES